MGEHPSEADHRLSRHASAPDMGRLQRARESALIRCGLVWVVEYRLALWSATAGATAMAVVSRRRRLGPRGWLVAGAAPLLVWLAVGALPPEPLDWWNVLSAVVGMALLLGTALVVIFTVGEGPVVRRLAEDDYEALLEFTNAVGRRRTSYQWTLSVHHGRLVDQLLRWLGERDAAWLTAADRDGPPAADDEVARCRSLLIAEARSLGSD